jgi:anti-anti-sigma factor
VDRTEMPAPIHGPSLSIRPLRGRSGIEVTGSIDRSNASALSEIVGGLGPDEACLDLTGLELLDGSGVRILLEAAHRVHDLGGELTLIGPGYIIRRALSVLTPEDLLSTIRIVER